MGPSSKPAAFHGQLSWPRRVLPSDLLTNLNPGESFSFHLVTTLIKPRFT